MNSSSVNDRLPMLRKRGVEDATAVEGGRLFLRTVIDNATTQQCGIGGTFGPNILGSAGLHSSRTAQKVAIPFGISLQYSNSLFMIYMMPLGQNASYGLVLWCSAPDAETSLCL